MIRWNNDYNQTAHPAILDALAACAGQSYGGYGLDEWCDKATAMIRAQTGRVDAAVHFLTGGTQANLTVIAAALRPYQSVICADSGHVHAHETGAIENTGHKLHVLPGQDGKLTADQIEAEVKACRTSTVPEHITQPGLVFLAYPTEYGTLYSKQELRDIRAVCDAYGLYLYVDGARLSYGLAAPQSDVTLRDLAALCDAFYLGGTKCGALMGEAVVLLNDAMGDHFRSYMKQHGGLLAKGFLIGLQFAALLEDDRYLSIARRAVDQALRLQKGFRAAGLPLFLDSPTNQQFVVLSEAQMDALARRHVFEYIAPADADRHCVRFCTSWSTRDEDVDALLTDLRAL